MHTTKAIAAAVTLAVASCSGAPPAFAKLAHCYAAINTNDPVLDTTCDVLSHGTANSHDTSTSLTFASNKGNKIVVLIAYDTYALRHQTGGGKTVQVTILMADGRTEREFYGPVKPVDACWVGTGENNSKVRICAWPFTPAEQNNTLKPEDYGSEWKTDGFPTEPRYTFKDFNIFMDGDLTKCDASHKCTEQPKSSAD